MLKRCSIIVTYLFIFIHCEENATCVVSCTEKRLHCEFKRNYVTENNCTSGLAVTVAYINNNNFFEIRGLLDRMEMMKDLHLGNNSIKDLHELGNNLQQLQYLRLEHNRIRFVNSKDLQRFEALKFLSLADNDITHIQTKTFTNKIKIWNLDLSQNKIIHINEDAFLRNRALCYLFLQENKISNLAFLKHLPNLESLDLSANRIQALPQNAFSTLGKLRLLKLRLNKLSRIEFGTFSENKELQVLDLSNNQLLQLFTYPLFNHKLTSLDLQNNNLKKLDISRYIMNDCKRKTKVYIDNNKWTCRSLLDMMLVASNCLKLCYTTHNYSVINYEGIPCNISDDYYDYQHHHVSNLMSAEDYIYILKLLLIVLGVVGVLIFIRTLFKNYKGVKINKEHFLPTSSKYCEYR